MNKTKFEEDLKEYFPHIWKLHNMSKQDRLIWEVVDAMQDIYMNKSYGTVEIKYQDGKINQLNVTHQRHNKETYISG